MKAKRNATKQIDSNIIIISSLEDKVKLFNTSSSLALRPKIERALKIHFWYEWWRILFVTMQTILRIQSINSSFNFKKSRTNYCFELKSCSHRGFDRLLKRWIKYINQTNKQINSCWPQLKSVTKTSIFCMQKHSKK